ncbi:MAG: transcriptional regulator GcvA [Rhodospirillales bacterium]|jgi:LysR family glycine cleavage system transcriptional activator|nr:transcriptional regulator GcvA [Rhodospirillales bacterium]MDP7651941.1 transcriptional regulator GcvA [Rhodospirillales bacterium]HJO97609.1 transcriptional regulator GcvA [Rhodospirillales bacterium]
MARRLPPLNALRVFEAAARHLSFTRAAQELNVTQAAVSHQIKGLEEHLELKLFRRLNRALLLTDQGQAYFPPVRDALETLAQATKRLEVQDAGGTITVSTLTSFAANWLVPRLRRFRTLCPDVDVHISTTDDVVDFGRDNIDMAVRYGSGEWRGLDAQRLMTEEVFPVCSPSLLEDGPPLRTPADLGRYTLLHDEMREDWRMWLLAAGADHLNATRGPGFQHSNLVVQAAIAGEGVALGRSVLVADDLAAGRLIKPFDISLPAEFAYYVVCPEADAKRPKVAAFREWLLDEAAG